MKYKEINKLSNDELKSKFNSLKKDLFNLRFRKTNGQIENTASVSIAKKDIAKPTLTEVTVVSSPTSDSTPNYTFNSTEAGSISYAGSCISTTTTSVSAFQSI